MCLYMYIFEINSLYDFCIYVYFMLFLTTFTLSATFKKDLSPAHFETHMSIYVRL